ncbi:Alpha/Beta hydrolase protein [Colletotrichum cereale]|nr:Alpha/Beta hydrolase protein [Colletotrichum cereale]
MALPTLKENQFGHSGDKTTFYWSAGPSGGPLVILIHGWPANGETWKPQLLALASLGFRVVAPDNRGYGRSSVPKGPEAYALEHHVSDMMALLAHLGRDKAVWIGHDWGAGLVWGFASQHPDKCIGVCCMAVPYNVLDPETLLSLSNREVYPEDKYPWAQWDYQVFHNEQPEASAAQLHHNVPNTIKVLYSAGRPEYYGKPAFTSSVRERGGWFGDAPGAPDVPFETSLFKGDKPAFDRMVAEFERNGFEGPNDYYRNFELNKAFNEKAPNGRRLRFPVLFIEARWDNVCDTAISRLSEPMREFCEDLTEVTINAGHWVALEKPDETNAAIVRWIATKVPTYFPGYWKTPFVSRI